MKFRSRYPITFVMQDDVLKSHVLRNKQNTSRFDPMFEYINSGGLSEIDCS